jgi:vacuolar-type H+-ATPase subunit I/STV1
MENSVTREELEHYFDDIKELYRQTDEQFKESRKELDQRFKETDAKFKETDTKFKETDAKFKETDAKFKETDAKFKETDEKFKATDRKLNALQDLFTGQWGKLMESLVEGDLVNILRAKRIDVSDTSTRRKGRRNGENYEYDIIAHNGYEIVVVEVKTTLRVRHVKEFLAKLERAKIHMPEYHSHVVYGAIAFLRAEEGSERMAESSGLFVIRATGDSASVVNEEGFEPRKW